MTKKMSNPQWWEKTVEYAFVQNFLPHASSVAPLSGNSEQHFGDLLLNTNNKWFLIEFKRVRASIRDELVKYLKYDKNGKKLLEAELKIAKEAAAGIGHIEWLHANHKNLLDDHKDAIASHFFVYGDYNKKKSIFSLRHLPYWSDSHKVKVNEEIKPKTREEKIENTFRKPVAPVEPDRPGELQIGGLLQHLGRTFPFQSTANCEQMKDYLLALSKLRGNKPTPSDDSGGNALVVVSDVAKGQYYAFGEEALLAVIIKEGLYEQEKYINGS